MERSKAAQKKKEVTINNFLVFYKKWKKINDNLINKQKMDLNNRKMRNNPPSPA